MQVFRTDDNHVTKIIHDDQSETCIKTVYSVDYKPNPETGEVDTFVQDRNKYSVFISPSKGCPMNCQFCYLTIDGVPFRKLDHNTVIDNVKTAILTELENKDANLRDRFIKVCWMGMGEAILNPVLVRDGTNEILSWALTNGYAQGLDGVDISSVIPKMKFDPSSSQNWVHQFMLLNMELGRLSLNPNNKSVVNKERGDLVRYENRSPFRFFYSLHSAIQETRDLIIPNATPITIAKHYLKEVKRRGVDVIIHHMFLDNMNDNEMELNALVDFMKEFPDCELRILRYNRHERSSIVESAAFEQCVCYIQGKIRNIKVQCSYGLSVKSACGQFIYNDTAELESLKIKG